MTPMLLSAHLSCIQEAEYRHKRRSCTWISALWSSRYKIIWFWCRANDDWTYGGGLKRDPRGLLTFP